MSSSTLDDEAQLQKRLKFLMTLPENQSCCDCLDLRPTWASLIVPQIENAPTLGGFCCFKCSGLHRSLGTHICFVRSISLDDWKEKEVLAMERGGNQNINLIFEGKKIKARPDPNVDNVSREKFVRAKYVERKFYNPSMYQKISEQMTLEKYEQQVQQQQQLQEQQEAEQAKVAAAAAAEPMMPHLGRQTSMPDVFAPQFPPISPDLLQFENNKKKNNNMKLLDQQQMASFHSSFSWDSQHSGGGWGASKTSLFTPDNAHPHTMTTKEDIKLMFSPNPSASTKGSSSTKGSAMKKNGNTRKHNRDALSLSWHPTSPVATNNYKKGCIGKVEEGEEAPTNMEQKQRRRDRSLDASRSRSRSRTRKSGGREKPNTRGGSRGARRATKESQDTTIHTSSSETTTTSAEQASSAVENETKDDSDENPQEASAKEGYRSRFGRGARRRKRSSDGQPNSNDEDGLSDNEVDDTNNHNHSPSDLIERLKDTLNAEDKADSEKLAELMQALGYVPGSTKNPTTTATTADASAGDAQKESLNPSKPSRRQGNLRSASRRSLSTGRRPTRNTDRSMSVSSHRKKSSDLSPVPPSKANGGKKDNSGAGVSPAERSRSKSPRQSLRRHVADVRSKSSHSPARVGGRRAVRRHKSNDELVLVRLSPSRSRSADRRRRRPNRSSSDGDAGEPFVEVLESDEIVPLTGGESPRAPETAMIPKSSDHRSRATSVERRRLSTSQRSRPRRGGTGGVDRSSHSKDRPAGSRTRERRAARGGTTTTTAAPTTTPVAANGDESSEAPQDDEMVSVEDLIVKTWEVSDDDDDDDEDDLFASQSSFAEFERPNSLTSLK